MPAPGTEKISYLQAVTVGLLQGVTELFPISSLGHSVLLPALIGGSWGRLVTQEHLNESPYLAFLVGVHVATALALLLYYRHTWLRIIKGFFASLGKRRLDTPDERLAWLLICVTIPVGIIGLALEHTLRTIFARPTAAAVFLFCNGLIMLAGEYVRRRSLVRQADEHRPLETLELKEAGAIGLGQSLALLAGISRSGVTMVAGLLRGLDHEDAARFSFLAATPIILAAGLYKLPDLLGANGDGVRGQVLAGSVVAAVAAFFSVRFLERFFRTRTLTPFGIYSLIVGAGCFVRFGLVG